MKTIKKLCIFTLIVICSAYFVFKTATGFASNVQAEQNEVQDTTSNFGASSSEYEIYLADKKAHHQETYKDQTMYPQTNGIILNVDPTNPTKAQSVRQNDNEVKEFTFNVPQDRKSVV